MQVKRDNKRKRYTQERLTTYRFTYTVRPCNVAKGDPFNGTSRTFDGVWLYWVLKHKFHPQIARAIVFCTHRTFYHCRYYFSTREKIDYSCNMKKWMKGHDSTIICFWDYMPCNYSYAPSSPFSRHRINQHWDHGKSVEWK
jgi:hypothetical protein